MTRWNTEILSNPKCSKWSILFCVEMFALSQFSIKHHHLWLWIVRWELWFKSLLPQLLAITWATFLCCELEDWKFLKLNCLPAYIVAYVSVYNSFQLYHYVLSKLKWGVHKWVPTNEKILFMWYQPNETISFRRQFNLFHILKQHFSEDIWQNPELSEIPHCGILATAYMVFQILWRIFLSTNLQLYLKCH